MPEYADLWEFMQRETHPGASESSYKKFIRKIADGKLLLRYSYMTCNVTCDCCQAEQSIEYNPDFPDTLRHTSWCIVTAARSFFADFTPSPYPQVLRGYGSSHCAEQQFDWLRNE